MKDLHHYFDDERLVRILCRKRIELARKARRSQFIRSVSATSGTETARSKLNELLPPRRAWNGFRPTSEHRADPNVEAPSKLACSMSRYVMRELRRPKPLYRWVHRLRSFLSGVKHQALSWKDGDRFSYEEIYAFPKKTPGNNQKYRIVASYSLESSLICSGFAAYLRDRIDVALKSAVLSFRAPLGGAGGAPPCHHDAVAKILGLAEAAGPSASLWCAEADIEGFFDAVSHDIAMQETRRLLSWSGTTADPRLHSFLASFLNGYDYLNAAIPDAKAVLAKHGVTSPQFADPLKALAARGIIGGPIGKIGIPQGSAMSCVLANIVISSADALVCAHLEAFGERGDGLYLRYCDDIVIVHRQREVCESACNAYISAILGIRLPCHPLKPVAQYPGSRAHLGEHPESFFWTAKSKAPYLWADTPVGTAVPWLAFVGYQIRRDGSVRVRKSSVDKELSKQRRVATDIVKELRAASRKKRRDGLIHLVQDDGIVQYRAMMHLLSIGVGYPPEWKTAPAPGAVSWARGFKGMDTVHAVHEPLRRLDQGRNHVLRYLRAQVRWMIARGLLRVKPKTQKTLGKTPYRLRFAGRELSYSYQFRT